MSTTTRTDTSNWFATRARIAKAEVIASFLKGEGVTAAEAVDYPENARRAAAKLAGKNGCSADTWALVVAQLVMGTPPWRVRATTVKPTTRVKVYEAPRTPNYEAVTVHFSCGCTEHLHPMATALDNGIAICPSHGPVTITSTEAPK